MKTGKISWWLRTAAGAVALLLLLPALAGAAPLRQPNSDGPDRLATSPAPVPYPAGDGSVPLPDDFRLRIQTSKQTADFQSNGLRTRGWTIKYSLGREYFPTDGPPKADGSRVAIVPMVDKTGFGVGTLNFTFNPTTNVEGVSVAVFIPGSGSSVLRDYTEPTLTTYVDMKVDAKGTVVDGSGVCPIAVSSVASGNSSLRLMTAASASCGYWDCVLAAVLELALAGQESGINEACQAACLAGGVANPACLACLAGAVVVLGGVWWTCY